MYLYVCIYVYIHIYFVIRFTKSKLIAESVPLLNLPEKIYCPLF